ncbi:MAG: BrnT family toxin [Betaproteobacteria bacterium]|jgi:uncharacterized DUF497 family protein
MLLEWDNTKRQTALKERGLDFADCGEVFAGRHLSFPDLRREYGEPRMIPVGELHGRMVVIAWTQRGQARRIFSMRKANEREQEIYRLG